ncbi:MAG: tRNA guanosine(34) transglycosylase Tgt [Candidatus Kapabacteria bacterium]|nr:tRNA guanosine(34) transglycosylase Tgt [Candidatus Kapabacteria bacterium]MCS7169561.1 tRNA guanosine(34) transglycosylase Tgt [Candidatus Kapabacteria bacterium]MDW7997798.1 tRNA guanosine(34) transglycosylase Tgt [Bacteroidota bacterium]MDW8225054.1 tRNA guanosine(34) transglycosylase Tgt [Bacteroidota bacterium]
MAPETIGFQTTATDPQSNARVGLLRTAHGPVETPAFMPVGTQGTIKALDHRRAHELGVQILLCNAYHLYLRPGIEAIERSGGLHRFIGWEKPILTDSGGYQIFSLQQLRRLSDDGVEFRSHIDGSLHRFTPELVIAIQRSLGSDIMMTLDECPPYPAERAVLECAVRRTLLWAQRAWQAFQSSAPRYGSRQLLFGIGQGGTDPTLRRQCLSELCQWNFDGFAIGGLSVGEPTELLYDMVALSTELLPADRPRYLMGVGTPENILTSIEHGVDLFDCVLPTRNARNGQLFTTRGKINIHNARWRHSDEPIDPEVDHPVSRTVTLGYLRHLFTAGEVTALILATEHNLAFYHWLLATARQKIRDGSFRHWKRSFLERLQQAKVETSDEDPNAANLRSRCSTGR